MHCVNTAPWLVLPVAPSCLRRWFWVLLLSSREWWWLMLVSWSWQASLKTIS
jgi:hypothetical protein